MVLTKLSAFSSFLVAASDKATMLMLVTSGSGSNDSAPSQPEPPWTAELK